MIVPRQTHVDKVGRCAEGLSVKTMLAAPVMQFVEGLVASGQFESAEAAIVEKSAIVEG